MLISPSFSLLYDCHSGRMLGGLYVKQLSELGVNNHGFGVSMLEELRSVMSVLIRHFIWQWCSPSRLL